MIFVIVIISWLCIQNLAVIESMHLALENVVSTIFDGSNEYGKIKTKALLSLHQVFEGLVNTSWYI